MNTRTDAAAGRMEQALRDVEEARAAAVAVGLQSFAATVAAGVAAHVGDGARAVSFADDAMAELEGLGMAKEAMAAKTASQTGAPPTSPDRT